ncbi:39S ribosomal protein L28, mitochondrial [Anthonomus grandis grandis]|uniref:39S ribosomal protein L28, mitochondrial n=1 Tax=Anthonomus grandis grandis TaxID=2921223 RepID=UPI002166844F|nr:39S ribosomal protein L28, mitochondrial [Anthonomus grandis grandis]
MASKVVKSVKTLGVFQKPGLFDKGTGALLPEAYKKFYKEWRLTEPSAVHYIPEDGKWKRDEVTGEVHPVQNIPLPLIYPKEHNRHMWGGEGIVQGFFKRAHNRRRVPHFWTPLLQRTVVHSEVLDKFFSVVVTDRTIHLINSNYGFDHYLLKTPACDLKSLLPLGLKRKILKELEAGCPSLKDKPQVQKRVLEKYGKYLDAYTSEEIDWYGYSYTEACRRLEEQIESQKTVVPLKHVYRSQLIDKLRAANIEEAMTQSLKSSGLPETWLQKMNPFGKKKTT